MSAPAPLRHYYAAPERPRADGDADARVCQRAGCGRPSTDPVHLTPGDDDALHDAIRAASPHPEPRRTPEQDDAAIARATKRHAARWTFGTATTSADAGGTVTVDLGRSTPPAAG